MNARDLGFDEGRLERLTLAIETDVAEERYDGAVVLVARRGEIVLHEALGFFLRGEGIFPMPFGLTASPRTFGGLGAGSTMFWVDPQRDIVFVCLTAGLLEESQNFERLQRLSDLVLSAVVD
jgi:CubicO group peptidase (beta-lactamase class C family)